VAAVNAERAAGFPSGRLFLDSIEQALAVTLVSNYAFQSPSPRIYRGGLTPARLRKVVELVDAEMDGDLSLEELAGAAGLSINHFSEMFRQSTGQSPHQFVLHRRVDRAKEMLRVDESRVVDVAVACGFKSQQHFARVFRTVCGASPTEYRQEFPVSCAGVLGHRRRLAAKASPDAKPRESREGAVARLTASLAAFLSSRRANLPLGS
jgi:AraC family transcriptional regulator